jgi:predicted DsbA family dithiol-disulfide isomerase
MNGHAQFTIQIEIWSDIVCPFCYIGKRNLETALARFPQRDAVRVHWKSFELDAHRELNPGASIYELLASKYGRDVAWVKRATADTALRAKQAGLNFDFDRAIPANTFDAHRLLHLADRHGLQGALEEKLMAGYFTHGLNIADAATLEKIATETGLQRSDVKSVLETDAFAADVHRDEAEAMKLGVGGVPFFLIDREIPISGAHPVETFLAALESAARSQR